MSYIKLEVRSGGIYCKQEKEWKEIQFGNLFLYPPETKGEKKKEVNLALHPENVTQKVLSLVRDSSIKGLFSYLVGEIKKVKEIETSSEPSKKKLNLTLDRIVETSVYKKISEPYVTTFFQRKDVHRKTSKFITPPSINLNQHTFETADPTIKLLEKPLNNILLSQPKSLGEVHSFFKKDVIKKTEIEKYEKLKNDIIPITDNLKKFPDSKIKIGIETALERVRDEKPISCQVITLIKEIINLCSEDKVFLKQIKNSKYGKFSIFTDLSNTKHWVNKSHYQIVRGTPAYIACVDFDIYLSKSNFIANNNSESFSWEEIVNKIKDGPNIARWGEGGVVFTDYSGLDEIGCPYNEKDQLFIEIKSLRNAGLKIKKYDWEIEKKMKKVK